MMSKPIPIANSPLREQQRHYTAPAEVPVAFQPQPQRPQCKPVVYRVGPSGSTVVNAGQRPSMAYAAYEENDCGAGINAQQLNAYRERVLQETLRRMNVLNCRDQDNKENSANTPASSDQARHTLSQRTFGNDVNEFVTSGTSGSTANCDQDSDEERRCGSDPS
ncbi:hypothetical protein AAVH_22358 [Aphelenchoides avenae]|nr:hypothetical protein AAVH_22358 [Aphelenchus avenae]